MQEEHRKPLRPFDMDGHSTTEENEDTNTTIKKIKHLFPLSQTFHPPRFVALHLFHTARSTHHDDFRLPRMKRLQFISKPSKILFLRAQDFVAPSLPVFVRLPHQVPQHVRVPTRRRCLRRVRVGNRANDAFVDFTLPQRDCL
jgi:hypothetical protein